MLNESVNRSLGNTLDNTEGEGAGVLLRLGDLNAKQRPRSTAQPKLTCSQTQQRLTVGFHWFFTLNRCNVW